MHAVLVEEVEIDKTTEAAVMFGDGMNLMTLNMTVTGMQKKQFNDAEILGTPSDLEERLQMRLVVHV